MYLLIVVNALADMGQKKAIVPLISTLNTLNNNKVPLRNRVAIRNAQKNLQTKIMAWMPMLG